MTTLADWLAHNPHLPLERAPDEWDGCAFWQVETCLGRHIVLAPDLDYADRAALRHFGEANRPTAIDGPLAFPVLPLVGWAQYLDAVLVLEGDPATPAIRSPDSSPALDTDLAFMDALREPVELMMLSSNVRRASAKADRWERMHAARLRHLESVGAIGEREGSPEWDGERWRA